MERVKLRIFHKGKFVAETSVRKGLGFQAVDPKLKSPIEYDCRKADCGICIMRVLKGAEHLSPPTAPEKDFLKAMHADPEERLACQTNIFGDCDVDVELD